MAQTREGDPSVDPVTARALGEEFPWPEVLLGVLPRDLPERPEGTNGGRGAVRDRGLLLRRWSLEGSRSSSDLYRSLIGVSLPQGSWQRSELFGFSSRPRAPAGSWPSALNSFRAAHKQFRPLGCPAEEQPVANHCPSSGPAHSWKGHTQDCASPPRPSPKARAVDITWAHGILLQQTETFNGRSRHAHTSLSLE